MVRRVWPAQWQAYREVRLLALRSDPAAFSSTLEHEEGLDEPRWRQRLQNGVFVASVGGEAAGLVGGIRSPDRERGAELVSMWVAPAWRGTDVAQRLITAVAEWARLEEYEALYLWVVEGNERAERAYAKAGFVRTGRTQPVREGEPAMEFEMELSNFGEAPREATT